MTQKFKFLEHTADIKFQAFGTSLEKAFENSALAMFNAMYDGKVTKKITKKIRVRGKDLENLLYNFLEELLFLLDTQGFFLAKCKAKIKENKKVKNQLKLTAELLGDKSSNYSINLDVKAVTYNEMFIKQEKNKWVCQVVLDV